MKDVKEIIRNFMQLFRGYEKAHGQHELFGKPDDHGKIKGKARTLGVGAGEKEYIEHLEGHGKSLGLIPLMQDDTCWFVAGDIDLPQLKARGETPVKLELRIRKMDLPLVVCQSKSCGAHLYAFGREPLPVKLARKKMQEWTAALGYGGCEIFPKQDTRVNESDFGNWINIAYYGALKEGTTRYCIRNGKPILKLEEFLKYAEMMRISKQTLRETEIKLSEHFADGPPCLQHLATVGFEVGGRNNALINISTYMKKAFPDGWEDKVRDYNGEFNEPLPGEEVDQVIRNASRKDYFYTCKEPPICNHCDKKLCATRKFGIDGGGGGDAVPLLEDITKCIAKDSVRWYASFNGTRFEMSTDQQLSPLAFKKLIWEKCSAMVNVKQKDLDAFWVEQLPNIQILNDPEDASRQGQFENLLDNFFSHSRPARNRDEIIKGNSFLEDGRIIFRSEELIKYLQVRRFQHTPHEIWGWLRGEPHDGKSLQIRVKGRMLRVWSILAPPKFDETPIALPAKVEEEL